MSAALTSVQSPAAPRIFSGVQPSGHLTIGNYLGAIKNWVILQETMSALFCVVDLHALTIPQDPSALQASIREVIALYLACGVNPTQSTIFVQSHVPAHSELAWLLGCVTPMGWLNRMTQFKEKAGKKRENAALGLYAYPVLQAADILLYQTTHVPVGEDQKQHIELARDIAASFNHRYQETLFILPEYCPFKEATRIMSLRDGLKKMSKSDESAYARIELMDSNDQIVLKIQKAKTDSFPLPECPQELENRPEAKNLLTIYGAFSDLSLTQVCHEFSGASFTTLKSALIETITTYLSPIRRQATSFLQDPHHLDLLVQEGANKANSLAQTTLKKVQKSMGIGARV